MDENEFEKEVVKIRTFSGRIITLTVIEKNTHQLKGLDKFGVDVVVLRDDIESMYPVAKKLPRGVFFGK